MDRSLDYLLPCIRQNAETIEVLCTGIVSVNAAMRLMYLLGALMDGKSISFQKEEGAFVGLDVTIKFKYVIVVIICAVAIMGGTSYYSSVYPEQKVTDVQDTVTQNEMQSPVDDEGFVFAKSSSEMLSEEMVLALSDDRTVGFQRLLRMSINEIYILYNYAVKDQEGLLSLLAQYDYPNIKEDMG